MTEIEDDYLTASEKSVKRDLKTEYYNNLFLKTATTPASKKDFMTTVMDQIAYTDHTKNQKIFSFTDKKHYQMSWYNLFPTDVDIYVKAYDIMKASIVTRGENMLQSTIARFERKDEFVNFAKPVNYFIVPYPGCKTESCTIMGGRKTRKHTRSKRVKRSRKHANKRTKKSRKSYLSK